MANEEGKCIKCGDPVYVAPNGHVAKLCALCIFQAFANLGVFEQPAHLTPLAPDLGWVCGKCKTHNADGVLLCGFCDTPRLSG